MNAQVPRTISFQGYLSDASGNPLIDGTHSFVFTVFDQATGGTPLFTEAQSVVVVRGMFNAILGSSTSGGIPQSVAADRPYFLDVAVDGGASLAPRTPMTSVPYALRAAITDAVAPNATGVVTSINGADGAITLQGEGSTTVNRSGDVVTISSSGGSGGNGIQGVQNTDGSLAITNANGPVATIDIADGGVTASKLASGAIPTSLPPNGTAGGDLAGNYPNPTVAKLQGSAVSTTAPTSGQALIWNGTQWAPASAGLTLPYSATVSNAGPLLSIRNSGSGAGAEFKASNGTNTALLLSGGIRQSGGSILSTGDTGGVGISGAGVRFLWSPKLRALRAGEVTGDLWDSVNIGLNSVAMGSNTKASGLVSTALGANTTASGERSTALGTQSMASGQASTAMGRYTTASGFVSTAMGFNTTASGDSSTAMGGSTTASGASSTAMGVSTTASGASSTAMGVSTTASGPGSTAMGVSTTASGLGSTAMGVFTTASGSYSLATGWNTTASGAYSTAMGYKASTGGFDGSFVYGDYSPNVAIPTSTASNQFIVRASGGFFFYTNSGSTVGARLLANANSWVTISDSARKENRLATSGERVLQSIRGMWLGSWNYKEQDAKLYRHYGPMAQEFYAAFGNDGIGICGNDTTIASADFDGINMIAIQALEKRTAELKDVQIELQKKTAELENLRAEVESLKRGMDQIEELRAQLRRLEQNTELKRASSR
jgi:hypothetical protein